MGVVDRWALVLEQQFNECDVDKKPTSVLKMLILNKNHSKSLNENEVRDKVIDLLQLEAKPNLEHHYKTWSVT